MANGDPNAGGSVPSGSPNPEEQQTMAGVLNDTIVGWTLETFATPFVDWLKQKSQEAKWRHFDWPKAEQAYLDKVIKLYDRVRILGHAEDVPLGNIFTQVYILDKPTAHQRYDIEELRKQSWKRDDFQRQLGKSLHGMEQVKKRQNLFILGKPGAGKTTFLKYIAVQAARKLVPRVPIFVSLNQWADSRWGKGSSAALLPFIVEQFEICNFPDAELFIDHLLQEGQALVLFDGLDEVKQEAEQRRRLTRLLQNFANKYDKSQHLITCRIAATEFSFAGFVNVEVADFTPDQVQEYARKWFDKQAKKFDAFTMELNKSENRGLAELGKTPLLLSLLCLTFDNNMRFPPNLAELYEDALDALLRRWDASREIQRDNIYRELSHKRKLQLLMSIAVPNFEKGELFFRQRDLERWIVEYLAKLPNAPAADKLDGTALLKALEAQHSLLVERAQGIYSFSHLTFQEYLTARYLTENQSRGVIHMLIRNHLTDRRWREVFLLTASLLDNGDDFIYTMQQSIAAIAHSAPVLFNLLMWAQTCSQRSRVSVERRSAVQLAYIFLACAHEPSSTRDLARSLSRTLERALNLDRDFSRSLARVFDLSLDLSLDRTVPFVFEQTKGIQFARALNFALSQDQSLVFAFVGMTTAYVGFDYSLYYVWAYAILFASDASDHTDQSWQAAIQQFGSFFENVVALANKLDLGDLVHRLAELPIPSAHTSTQEWQHYVDLLFTLLNDKLDLKQEWNFHWEENNKLNDYFYANELLVQCLKVAAVSDRQAVLNSLLLPPAQQESEA